MEAQQKVEVVNPYWDTVAEHVEECRYEWDKGHYEVGNPLNRDDDGTAWRGSVLERRWELVAKYAWTITDPGTLAFVDAFSTGRMVDPMAGTGYWAYLLSQIDIDVVCYDLEPGGNHWHKDEEMFVPITQMDAVDSVKLHADRTLLLAWPPYSHKIGHRTLQAYEGDRVVYVGEDQGGCCGDDDMFDLLNAEWNGIAAHRPVQWFGVHDLVTVYDRRGTCT